MDSAKVGCGCLLAGAGILLICSHLGPYCLYAFAGVCLYGICVLIGDVLKWLAK